jgi:DNA polymerase elongation subunit (family B)
MRYLICDVETAPIVDAATYLTEPVEAPSNYKDPEKIAAYIEAEKQKQLAKAALDIDLARIVCLGVATEAGQHVFTIPDETQEGNVLGRFWDQFFEGPQHNWHTMVTFNGMAFDVPLLLRRSLYLGVKAPKLQLDRYKHPEVIDLMTLLNLDGRLKSHSLRFYANRFKIAVDDESTGADIGALVATGDWAAVEKHCAADVQTTYALAKRMGVL